MEIERESTNKFKDYIQNEIYENKKLSYWNKINRKYFIASYNSIYLIRILQRIDKSSIWGKKLMGGYIKNKLIKKYGIFIHGNAVIGMGLKLPHPNGIIIGKNVVIGKRCTIYQQVTIGSAYKGDYLKGIGSQPNIGNDVILYSGSKVIGNINIANKTIIGANAVVNKSTKYNCSYGGIPAKILKTL